MGLFLKLIAVLKAALPLPAWLDRAAVEAWLTGLAPPEADLISTIAAQLLATGHVDFDLPDGAVVSIALADDGKPTMSDYHLDLLAATLAAELPERDARGWAQWIAIALELLPIILDIFRRLFPSPSPTPEPTPPPVV